MKLQDVFYLSEFVSSISVSAFLATSRNVPIFEMPELRFETGS